MRLWNIVAVVAGVVTAIGTIRTRIVIAIFGALRTGQEGPTIEDTEDERDGLINLRGYRLVHGVYPLADSMLFLVFALGRPALVIIAGQNVSGPVGQISDDSCRPAAASAPGRAQSRLICAGFRIGGDPSGPEVN